MKLGEHKHSKVKEPDFSGRFSFAQKRGKNGLNMDFFVNFSKFGVVSYFSDFLYEVRGP